MKELIEALHVIQDECNRQCLNCDNCPLGGKDNDGSFYCNIKLEAPFNWTINDGFQKALL